MSGPVQEHIELLETAERRQEVIRKKRMGKTYRTIADEMETEFGPDRLPNGWGPRYACQDVKAELDKYRDELRTGIEQLVEMQVQRIEEMVLSLYPKAQSGDEDAINQIRKLMKRKAELLGLDEAEEYVLSGGADGFQFGWANPEDAPKPNGTTNGKPEPE